MKHRHSWTVGLAAILIIAVFVGPSMADLVADELKSVAANRTTDGIKIDGSLDEADWQGGPYASGFTQMEPEEGESATENTLVKILYDDEALYVGFWCNDSEPERIVRQLTRRDRWSASDKVAVRLDSYHDHQTGYYFEVNAAGVLRDILIYNDNWMDSRWNAVWDGNARVTSRGWTAEFKIPYSAIRFSEAEVHEWGLDLRRIISRKNEALMWQFVPSSEQQGVSRYGHLTGLEGISPPSHFETLPYFVSYGANQDDRSFYSNAGLDLKYALTSSITVDATFNPDFGQVESDGAVMNLGTFESYFSERRPFFLEGMEIFDVPAFNLFYSRRIGRAPTGWPDEMDGDTNASLRFRPGGSFSSLAVAWSARPTMTNTSSARDLGKPRSRQ